LTATLYRSTVMHSILYGEPCKDTLNGLLEWSPGATKPLTRDCDLYIVLLSNSSLLHTMLHSDLDSSPCATCIPQAWCHAKFGLLVLNWHYATLGLAHYNTIGLLVLIFCVTLGFVPGTLLQPSYLLELRDINLTIFMCMMLTLHPNCLVLQIHMSKLRDFGKFRSCDLACSGPWDQLVVVTACDV
jgi:hypothetical protein